MSELTQKSCVPCQGGVPPLQGEELETLLKELGGDWAVVDGHHLEKTYRFKNFRDAMAFAVKCGMVAEVEAHHPDLYVAWGKVKAIIWTHKIDGLTESDFVLAAKLDELL